MVLIGETSGTPQRSMKPDYIYIRIGVAASGILMLIPPRSGRTMVRKANAKALLELSRIHSMLVEGQPLYSVLFRESLAQLSISHQSVWVDAGDVDYRDPDPETKARMDQLRARYLKLSGRLALLKGQTAIAAYEVGAISVSSSGTRRL